MPHHDIFKLKVSKVEDVSVDESPVFLEISTRIVKQAKEPS